MSEDLALLSADELSVLVRTRRVSPTELVEATLQRTERLDVTLHAYMTILSEEARRAAQGLEAELASGNYRGPLHGVPVAVKDLCATRGIRTTAGSRILAEWVPEYDATVVERLRSAGAVLIGKLHMNEFADGMSQLNAHYVTPKNPWNLDRIPGSSSSGSAVAVAAALCSGALGTDTGGSIREPASFCGVVGLKPTYGRVSRFGIVPLSWSLDHVGPIARSVADAALLLQAIAGHDTRDPSSSRTSVPDYRGALDRDIRGIKVGVLTGHFGRGMNREVQGAVATAVQVLKEQGAVIAEVDLTAAEYAAPVYETIVSSEALTFHEKWLKSRPGDYGPDVRERLLRGVPILATQYLKAQKARALMVREVDASLDRVDVLVSPTLSVAAPRFDQNTVVIDGKEEDLWTTLYRFTRHFNVTGHPAISVPCGFTHEQLPTGFQIIGRRFDEKTLLRVAHTYEAAGQHKRVAPV
jgi:aspartyl-tRNA(Asn)/glutamyl-tRNA(Gln) amidotransferase subunit A